MRTTRRLSMAALLGVAAMLFAALPVAASCEESVAACGLDHDKTEARAVALTQISAIVDLRNDNDGLSVSLYRSLLPPAYGMPTNPQVAVSIARTKTPGGPLAGAHGTRTDAAIALKVAHDGEEGWYPLALPTTSAAAVDSGRADGLPRSLATATVAEAGEAWSGTVSIADAQRMALTWTGGDADLPTDARNTAWAQHHEPLLGLSPVFKGPDRTRHKTTYKAPLPITDFGVPAPQIEGATALSEPQPGTVHMILDPDLSTYDDDSEPLPALSFGEGQSLADIIAVDVAVPGLFWQTDATEITQTDNLDDGQDGPLPAATLPCAQAVAGPSASATGFATPVLVVDQGGCVDFTNLEEMQHDITSTGRDPVTRKPYFSSPYTSMGETKRVEGVESVPPGDYPFNCSLHGGMTGTLKILDT